MEGLGIAVPSKSQMLAAMPELYHPPLKPYLLQVSGWLCSDKWGAQRHSCLHSSSSPQLQQEVCLVCPSQQNK